MSAMIVRRPTQEELARLRGIAKYQFSEKVANVFFSRQNNVGILVEVTGKGSLRGVLHGEKRVATLRPTDGLFSLGLYGASLILDAESAPRFRVIIRCDRELSGSVLVADYVDMDPLLRPGDEAIVVDENDRLIGVGRLRIPRGMIPGLSRGEIVRLRRRAVKCAED